MQNNFRHSLCYFGRRINLLLSEKKVRVTSTPSYSANAIFGGDTHNYSRTNITIHKPKNPIITGPYRSIRFVRGFCKLWIVGWPCVSMHGERFLKDSSLLHKSIRLAVERRPPFWILHRPPARSLQATSLLVSRAPTQRAKSEFDVFAIKYDQACLRNWGNFRVFIVFKAVLIIQAAFQLSSIVHIVKNQKYHSAWGWQIHSYLPLVQFLRTLTWFSSVYMYERTPRKKIAFRKLSTGRETQTWKQVFPGSRLVTQQTVFLVLDFY